MISCYSGLRNKHLPESVAHKSEGARRNSDIHRRQILAASRGDGRVRVLFRARKQGGEVVGLVVPVEDYSLIAKDDHPCGIGQVLQPHTDIVPGIVVVHCPFQPP
jgi:hypothetical protein